MLERVKSQLSLALGLLIVVSSVLTACSSNEKKTDTPEGAFALAEEFDKDERYDEAIKRYFEVRNKFAYSRFATKAELAIADAYFKQESFAEAQVAYQQFKDLHPKHPQIDYVTFQVAMSYFKQLPATIDRDLTLASSAILYFEEVETRYPNSQYAKEAGERRIECLKMLAEKEAYIGDFYFRKKNYDSALARYEGLYQKYPNLGFDARALSQSAISAYRAGDLDRAKTWLRQLEQKFPDASETQAAIKEVR